MWTLSKKPVTSTPQQIHVLTMLSYHGESHTHTHVRTLARSLETHKAWHSPLTCSQGSAQMPYTCPVASPNINTAWQPAFPLCMSVLTDGQKLHHVWIGERDLVKVIMNWQQKRHAIHSYLQKEAELTVKLLPGSCWYWTGIDCKKNGYMLTYTSQLYVHYCIYSSSQWETLYLVRKWKN